MKLKADWSYPTHIKIGEGRIGEIAEVCRSLDIKKPLLVTDKGLKDREITLNTIALLNSADLKVALFTDFEPNPDDVSIEAGVKAFREGKHDGVIAFGGGSALDVGKAIAFMTGQTRPIADFEDIGDHWKRAETKGIFPIIAVPTTAGTGSEVGRASVITLSASSEKKIIFHPLMLPKVVIADPVLTTAMPPHITAGTGMDAFAHCLEAFCSPHYHPMSQGIALEGMRLVKENLQKVYKNGSDIEARTHMMSTAAMGAVAFQKGLGAIHAVSHPIGALYGTHHGTTNAAVMLQVLNFNRPAIEDKIKFATAFLELEGGFDGFYAWLKNLIADLQIPPNLTALGVKNPDIEKITEGAAKDPSVFGNPIQLTPENLRQLIQSCF